MDFIKHADVASWQPDPPKASDAPEIGSTRSFIPAVFLYAQGGSTLTSYGLGDDELRVTGVCVSVNRDHRLARYRFETKHGLIAHECFKY